MTQNEYEDSLTEIVTECYITNSLKKVIRRCYNNRYCMAKEIIQNCVGGRCIYQTPKRVLAIKIREMVKANKLKLSYANEILKNIGIEGGGNDTE